MEANFFRFLAHQIAPALVGRRVDKVFIPFSGAWTIKLGSSLHVICVVAHRHHVLCTSDFKPSNPQRPPAEVGWWRKRILGQRIVALQIDWPSRRLALSLDGPAHSWLVLDLDSGMSLTEALDPNFGLDPEWPLWEQIQDQQQIFRQFPQITPPLRYTLSVLDECAGRELISALQSKIPPQLFTWARPLSSQGRDWLVPWEIPTQLRGQFAQILTYEDAGQAAQDYCWAVLEDLGQAQAGKEVQIKRERKKLHRQLSRIAEDEERLQKMIARTKQAELIKSNLHRLDPKARVHHLELEDENGVSCPVSLDQRMSIQENMECMFQQAKKGARGLQHIDRRRREVEDSLAGLEKNGPGTKPPMDSTKPVVGQGLHVRTGKKKGADLKHISQYRSSDGLIILRGKNSRANHALLTRIARPHDLWFHAAQGPGAHVVLRRPGPAGKVSESSCLEAAGIAALRSHFAEAEKAEVMCAEVKHVSPIKGASPGQVTVREIMQTFRVGLDPELEKRLLLTD